MKLENLLEDEKAKLTNDYNYYYWFFFLYTKINNIFCNKKTISHLFQIFIKKKKRCD